MLPQDVIFSEYKEAFHQIQHPPETKFVKAYNSFGALDKTRVLYKEDFPQGCDYRVGEVREYSGTKESVETFYRDKTILVRGQATPMGIILLPVDSAGVINPYGLTREETIEWGPELFALLETLKDDQTHGFLKLHPLASYYFY